MATMNQLIHAIEQNGPVPCESAPDLYFPDPDAAAGQINSIHYAQQLCAACPIAATCLEYALESKENYGVWGGVNMGNRHRLFNRV